ncbi:CPBP family intramembrane glutamic endopeptidase [Winogradskyella sp.]|uniref:CPBP family intramembrane glutamic endopeptidase n=1 Tax=Winogradskyella sp. TaxID=1883156 RepID=UPI002628B2E5|nr:CPBP family intramembrane glutamic endopeptidase [Winogradskyella sp.]
MEKTFNIINPINKDHNLFQSLVLHLAPGILILCFYLITYNSFVETGFYAQTALTTSFLIIGATAPILFLMYLSKKNKIKIFTSIILFNKKLRWWEYVVYPIIVVILAVIISTALQPVSSRISNLLSDFLPQWFLRPHVIPDAISERNILITLIMVILIDGLIHPIVEEIYFRGFLLPRLARYKIYAPILGALFFALFHLWQPQNMLSIFLMSIPWLYIIWWKRSFLLSVIIHCLANTLGAVFGLMEFLQ